jgi:nucleotide-binding universal stress UspA family protein
MTDEAGTIVVGVDGSGASAEALHWALGQAAAERRAVTLVHVVHPGTPVWLDPTGKDPREARRLGLMDKGHDVLASVRPEVPGLQLNVEIRELVRIGDPREVLLELSETASMIVMGSRGMGPIRSLLLGSTSVAVVRHARCPVVVHRPSPTQTPAQTPRQGIAVGVDASMDALTVLDFAFRQALLRAEPLSVVYARHFSTSITGPEPFDEPPWAEDEEGVNLADRIAELSEKHPDVAVEALSGRDQPERLLLEVAERVNLLVVGVHHRSWAADITFGSMAVWLVEHASCPVAAVPLSSEL